MSTGTYFTVRNVLSFSTRGMSGRVYFFSLGKATLVSLQEDIKLFRAKSELCECNANGEPLVATATGDGYKPLSTVKYRPTNSPQQVVQANVSNVEAEETILDALKEAPKNKPDLKDDPDVIKRNEQIQKGELTEAQKLAMGLINEDGVKLADETGEDKKPKRKVKKKLSKSKEFQCDKCGKSFDTLDELDDHMELHYEEDDE